MGNNRFFLKITVCLAAVWLPMGLLAQIKPPTPITYGQSITDTINPASEIEVYTINALPGEILWIRVSPVNSVVNPKIEVRNPQGGLFGMSFTPNAFEMAQFRDTIPNNGGGVYTILVSDYGANNTGKFCITVDRFNSPPTAVLLNCGTSLSRSVDCNSSIKAFRYLVQQNAISRIVVSPVNSVLDLHVWVCTPDGSILAEDSAETFDPVMIDVTAAQTSCYYVFVGDTEGDNTGGFSISHALVFGNCATAAIQTTPVNGVVCEGDAFTLTVTTPLANPSFFWIGPNGFTSTQQTIDFTSVALAQAGLYTLTVTTPTNCSSTASTTITVKPTPTMTAPVNQTACGSTVLVIPFSGSAGSVFNWINSNPNIGLPVSGTGNLNFITTNIPVSQTANITVTPLLNGCSGSAHNFMITVNPTPSVGDPTDQIVCGGAVLNINFVGTPQGTSFNWSNSNPNIGLGTSGVGNIVFTAANVANQQTGTVTVTPILGSCTGTPQSFTITVKPTPVMNAPSNQTACGGTMLAVPFSGSPGATFNWTNSNTEIGLAASGTGSLNFTTKNTGTVQTATITVTPFLNGCSGSAHNFTIMVNPTPSVSDPVDQLVCGGAVLNINFVGTPQGTSFNWSNSNPNIGLGASGVGNIVFTAAGAASQQTGTVMVTPILDACTGTPQSFTITVKPTPVMNAPSNQTACGGTVLAVPFSGAPGATFSWTNSNTEIGLAASGTGSLNFTTKNTGTVQTATITVTPFLNGCSGSAHNFTIMVNPTPSVSDPVDQLVCGGAVLNINFVGTPQGTSFNWSNSNPAIGLGASGVGNIAFITANVASQLTGKITVTPILDVCTGTPRDFSITVKPVPTMSKPTDETACAGTAVSVIFNGTPAGTGFSWINSNPAIGLNSMGSGNIDFIAANVINAETGTITVIPTLNGCIGTPKNFNISINPEPAMGNQADQTVCEGATVNVNFVGTVGTNFSWVNSNPAIGLAAFGTGNIVFPAADVATVQTGIIAVTPFLAGCAGPVKVFNIIVNPKPTANFSFTVKNDTASFFANSLGGSTYAWDFGDGGVSSEQNPVHGYQSSRTYTVTLTVTNPCGTDVFIQEIVVVIISTGDLTWVEDFNLYPNPNNGAFTISLRGTPSQYIDFELLDMNGRSIGHRTADFRPGTLTFQLDFGALPAAMYLLRVRADRRVFYAPVAVE